MDENDDLPDIATNKHESDEKREKLLANIKRHIERIQHEAGVEDEATKKKGGKAKKTKNIVLIGPIGVGKSSTINTTAAAFSRKYWKELAEAGSYGLAGDTRTVNKKT